MKLNRMHLAAATVSVLGVAALAPGALASPPSGFTATPLVTANLDHTVDIRSDGIRLKTNGPTDVAVQRIVIEPGGSSGWHRHPGIVMVAVLEGRVAVWDEDCNVKRYGIGLRNGSVFVESGDHAGKVTSFKGATTYATFMAPNANPPVFRIEDNPRRCRNQS